MKIQLFAATHTGHFGYENLGISRIAAFLLLKEVQVKTTNLYYGNDFEKEKLKIDEDSDMYGFSAYHDNIDFIFSVAGEIKRQKEDALIFLGSRFATDAALDILADCPLVDFIVLGTGEFPLYHFIQALEQGNDFAGACKMNPNIVSAFDYEGKSVCNTDIQWLPLPDRSHIVPGNKLIAYISSAHGCTGRCSFCSVTGKGVRWNGRSAMSIFNEIVNLNKQYQIRCFIFTDGSFEDRGKQGRRKIEELCSLLKEYPVKMGFRCFLRVETITSREADLALLLLMREAGFTNIALGIDAGNETDLKLYNKIATLEQNKTVLSLYRSCGIEPLYGFIFFNPYSTETTLLENYHFLSQQCCIEMEHYISTLQVYVGTDIHVRLKEEGVLLESYDYKSVYAYRFISEHTKRVHSFISEVIQPSNAVRMASGFTYFIQLYNFYLVLNPEDSDMQKLVCSIKNRISTLCGAYFSTLYEKRDLQLAYDRFADFQNSLCMEYKRSEDLKYVLLRKILKNR